MSVLQTAQCLLGGYVGWELPAIEVIAERVRRIEDEAGLLHQFPTFLHVLAAADELEVIHIH